MRKRRESNNVIVIISGDLLSKRNDKGHATSRVWLEQSGKRTKFMQPNTGLATQ